MPIERRTKSAPVKSIAGPKHVAIGPRHGPDSRPRASSLSSILKVKKETVTGGVSPKPSAPATEITPERHAHFADNPTGHSTKIHAPILHDGVLNPNPIRGALVVKPADLVDTARPVPHPAGHIVPPQEHETFGHHHPDHRAVVNHPVHDLGHHEPGSTLPPHPIGKPILTLALAPVLDPAVERARRFTLRKSVAFDDSTTPQNWKETGKTTKPHHTNEEYLRKRYTVLGMRPSFSLDILEEAKQVGPGLVYDPKDDLELRLDHQGSNCLKDITHVFLLPGSRALYEVVPTDIQFSNKYEVVCGNTHQRLFIACETLEEMNREKCCNDLAQPYELVILTPAGMGLYTMSRRRRDVIFSDFVNEIACMSPSGQNVDRLPQTYTFWEGEKELCRLITNPFADMGEYEIVVGSRDDYVGRIGRSWTDLREGQDSPYKERLGLKFNRDLNVKLKGFLVGALFNTYFTFDHGRDDTLTGHANKAEKKPKPKTK